MGSADQESQVKLLQRTNMRKRSFLALAKPHMPTELSTLICSH